MFYLCDASRIAKEVVCDKNNNNPNSRPTNTKKQKETQTYLCDAGWIAKEVICEERLWRSDFLEEPITAEQKCGKLEKK